MAKDLISDRLVEPSRAGDDFDRSQAESWVGAVWATMPLCALLTELPAKVGKESSVCVMSRLAEFTDLQTLDTARAAVELTQVPALLCSVGGSGKFVRGAEVYLECDAWAPAGAVAERVSEVAGGDVFRKACGELAGERHLRFFLEVKVGVAGLSFLDRSGAERGAAKAMTHSREDGAGSGQNHSGIAIMLNRRPLAAGRDLSKVSSKDLLVLAGSAFADELSG